jgi:acetolactate synthase I/II/III large subunit
VLAVGVSFNAATTNRWTLPIPRRLVQVDIDAQIIGRHYPIAVGVVGDARAAMQGLSRILVDAPVNSYRTWLDHCEVLRTAWREKVHPAEHATSVPIKPQWVMHESAALLEDDVIVVADAGNPGIWTHLLPIRHPRAYLKPVGFGLPAAIAARLAAPEKRVLLFVGDGSLGMSLAELETAIRMRTPIAIVVLNDLAYGNIKQEEEHYHGQRSIGVDFIDVPYADVARAMGADGERITQPQHVRSAIARALASPVPFLLDVRIDGSENVWKSPI